MSGARKYKGMTNILSNKERVQVATLKFSGKGAHTNLRVAEGEPSKGRENMRAREGHSHPGENKWGDESGPRMTAS